MKTLILVCFLAAIFSINVFSQINVSATGGTPTASYSTLTNAFTSINNGTHTGSITITVDAGTLADNTSAVLNASGSGSASFTSVLIRPGVACTTSSPCIIQGNTGSPKIDLNGADNVTIEGGNVNGDFALQIDNTSNLIASLGAIRFRNDASNNVVRNARLYARTSNTSSGVVLFSIGTTTGNDNNTVENCDISSSSTTFLPSRGIVSIGSSTAGVENDNNLIDANRIHDFFIISLDVAGIFIGTGNTNWTISNNKIYQSSPRTFTGVNLSYYGINIDNTSGSGFNVTRNVIGYANNAFSGTTSISGNPNKIVGINLNVGNSTATSVQGNTVAGFVFGMTGGTFTGIRGLNGRYNIGNTEGNTIGSLNSTGSISLFTSPSPQYGVFVGISDIAAGNSNNISNNKIGGINFQNTQSTSGFTGIYMAKTGILTGTISNNIVGGTVADSIAFNNAGALHGIWFEGSNSPTYTVTNNIVRNLTINGTVPTINGINNSGGSFSTGSTITGNLVHSLHATASTSAFVRGIYCNDFSGQGNVSRNFVHSLSSNVSFGAIYGIYANSNLSLISNNFIRLGIDKNGNSISTTPEVYGIFEEKRQNFFNNSVYIGGNSSNQTNSTYAFFSLVNVDSRSLINNIFANDRVKTGGAGFNYAVKYGNIGATTSGLDANYNMLYVSDVNSFVGRFNNANIADLATWQVTTLQDVNSLDFNPLFVNPTGNASSVNLHLPEFSSAKNNGTTVPQVLIDFDGQDRPEGTQYDIGADESMILILTDRDLGTGTVNFGLIRTFTADFGIPNYSWSFESGMLPPGIELNPNGTISGVPLVPGTYTFSLTATDDTPPLLTEKQQSTDGAPNTHTKEFIIEILAAPTAAPAEISGRVTTVNGRGIRNVMVSITGGGLTEPRFVLTNAFGHYRFEDLPVGQTYVVAIQSKRFSFPTTERIIDLQDNITDADFVSQNVD